MKHAAESFLRKPVLRPHIPYESAQDIQKQFAKLNNCVTYFK